MFGKLCGAKARTNEYKPCRQPAMKNGRCRLHGGYCKGATTQEGKFRQKMANWKHGKRSQEAVEEARLFRQYIKEVKQEIISIS